MARRPASGRGWTDDGRATGKSFRDPVEAWWKHEGENRCAILTIRARFGLVGLSRNWQDMRKKTRFVAPDRVSFDTAHNLKAAGSNPAPATNSLNDIRCLEPDLNSRVFACPKQLNATSTFDESPLKSGGLLRLGPSAGRNHPSCSYSENTSADPSRRIRNTA